MGGKLVAEYSTKLSQTPSTNYTTTDHLGSPRIITNELGQIKSRRDFMPFGEDLGENIGNRPASLKYGNADDIRQKFTGYLKDKETGLDFAEARMYQNQHGRFTAVDPLLASGKSANPQTFNRYIYVGNNPVITTDPLGLDWVKSINKDEDGKYSYRDVYGKELKKLIGKNGGFARVDFNGASSSDIYANGTAIYRMFAAGGGIDLPLPVATPQPINRTVLNFLRGFQTGAKQRQDGLLTGLKNTPIGLANGITNRLTMTEFSIPFVVTYRPGLWNNPFEITPYAYGSQNAADIGSAVPIGIMLGGGAAAGTMGGGSFSSVVPQRGTLTAESSFIGPKQLEYAPRVRERAVEDPKAHNFPYGFDNQILSTKAIVESNGYRFYRLEGTMNSSSRNKGDLKGIYEIGVTKDFIINHRYFKPTGRLPK